MFLFFCEQIVTLTLSDWVTGKRGRRNSVGSLDSTIEVSLTLLVAAVPVPVHVSE